MSESLDRDALRARFTRSLNTDVAARMRPADERESAARAAREGADTVVVGSRAVGVDYLSIKTRLHGRLLDEIGDKVAHASNGEEAISRAVEQFVEILAAQEQHVLYVRRLLLFGFGHWRSPKMRNPPDAYAPGGSQG